MKDLKTLKRERREKSSILFAEPNFQRLGTHDMKKNRRLEMSEKKKDEEIKAFLGKGAEFTGKLIFKGSVRIDGDFNGEIFGEGTLVVGEGAHIKADIKADHVLISGEVHGQIDVKERIEIYPPGRVLGNMKTPILIIKEGAVFEGNSRMGNESLEKA
jgi:cytoskeletal protein CcmA (bactofilin family)